MSHYKEFLTLSLFVDAKKPRIRSSSPAVQTGQASGAKAKTSASGVKVPAGANNSFTSGQKQLLGPAAAKATNMSNLNNKMVP